MKKNYIKLSVFILVPLLLGTFVGLLTVLNNNVDSIIPAWIFPIVWSILYILMGISSYLVYEETYKISKIYVIQLVFNLLWSFIFFKFKLFVLAFIWIIILILLVGLMIKDFIVKNKIAGYLQIPYFIWLVIASILNIMFIV